MNTFEFIRIPAEIVPDREALVYERRRYTFAQLEQQAVALAAGLRTRGVGPGHVVAALDTNSDRYVLAFYAAALLGATFVPLNFRARQDELAHVLAIAKVQTILAGEHYHALAAAAGSEIPTLRQFLSLDGAAPGWVAFQALPIPGASLDPVEVEDEDVNVIIFTSGTTFHSKGVLLRYADFSHYVLASAAPPAEDDRFAQLLVAPFYHIAGLTAILRAPYSGRRMVLLRQFEPIAWLEAVQAERITHAFVVPTMLKRLVDEPSFHAHDLSSLEVLAYGAAPTPPSVLHKALDLFPRTVGFVNTYGQTETTATVAMLWPEDHRLVGTPEEIELKRIRLSSVGKPLPDVQLRVVDEQHSPLPPHHVGELAIRTPRTMKGYLSDDGDKVYPPVQDDEGWLYTSDLGWIDDDGYVFLAGRKSERIIRGGENISPAEVEAVLQGHPAVEDVAVFGVPDDEWGERVVAIVVLRPEARGTVEGEALIAFCRERLASFKKPEVVAFVDDLPRSPLGKVLKLVLRQRYQTITPG